MEYDLKQRTEASNKQITEIRSDNENLQLSLNEKQAMNKKLYNDNNQLYRTLEQRNQEINELKDHINEIIDRNNKITEEKTQIEKYSTSLNDAKNIQKIQLDKYIDDCDKLNRICSEQEQSIKSLETERIKLHGKIEELAFENKNLLGKLRIKEDNLGYSQKQNDDLNKLNLKLQNTISEHEITIERFRTELNNCSNKLAKEQMIRNESEASNEQLDKLLKEKDKDNRRLLGELDERGGLIDKLNLDKQNKHGEIERLKAHVIILTEQNQKVCNFTITYPSLLRK